MRIGFVIWSLLRVQGGLERVGVNLAHAMQNHGHECCIFYQDAGPDTPEPVYPLDAGIEIANLRLGTEESLEYARHLLLEKRLDVLCAMFSWDSLLLFPTILNGTGIPFLISEHNNPWIIETERWNRYERIACMTGADAIHVLNEGFVSNFPHFLRERVTVIPNPGPRPQPVDWTRENTPRKRLLAVGRFHDSVKQFSLLIRAYALLASDFSEWELCICGDGPDREEYLQLIQSLGLEGMVWLPGKTDNIDEYYAFSHIFCIPSRHEGFPLVIVEAQSHGLPAVGFSCCNSVNEIIVHGKNGLLAQEMTPQSLAESLRPLMESASLRREMGTQGQALLERYNPSVVYAKWETLFEQVKLAKNRTRLNFATQNEEEKARTALREVLFRRQPFLPLLKDYAS